MNGKVDIDRQSAVALGPKLDELGNALLDACNDPKTEIEFDGKLEAFRQVATHFREMLKISARFGDAETGDGPSIASWRAKLRAVGGEE